MKLLFIAHMMLIDCGKASKQTKGQTYRLLFRSRRPSLNRYNRN